MVASRDIEGLGSRYSIIGYLASGKGSTSIVNKCILRKTCCPFNHRLELDLRFTGLEAVPAYTPSRPPS